MLALLSPWPWLVPEAATFIVQARMLIAVLFGATVYLAGKIANVRGMAALLLGLFAAWIADFSNVYIFRAESIAAFFVMVHLWWLTRLNRKRWAGLWAAAALALACTMSVRPMVFLAIQPLSIILLPVNRGRETGRWLLGIFVGSLPSLLYIGLHDLWREAWFWCFYFPSTVFKFSFTFRFLELAMLGFGALCLLLSSLNRRLPLQNKLVIVSAWSIAYLFLLIAPLRTEYSALYILLFSAIASAAAITPVKEYLDSRAVQQRAYRRCQWLSVGVLAVAVLAPLSSTLFDDLERAYRRNQLAVIEWLERIAQGQPVLLFEPHHPVTVPDVLDIHSPWHYMLLIDSPYFRKRLVPLADALLRHPPAVIAVDAWSVHTKGLNTLEWFFSKGIFTRQQVENIASLIESHYRQVRFPDLQALPYGHTYWVRQDLLIEPIPGRHTVSLPQVGAFPEPNQAPPTARRF